MVRISKKQERRSVSPRKLHKHASCSVKTGSLKDNLPKGYKEHGNAVEGDLAKQMFIAKVK